MYTAEHDTRIEYRGRTPVKCPVRGCFAVYTFTDTLQTVEEGRAIRARRETFMRAAHEAGRHEALPSTSQ